MANVEGRGEVALRTLVKNALRMRPDRIILGEARGGEALDVVQAMHSGHDGFLTVLHANSPRAALERLQTLMLMSGVDLPPHACRIQISSATDLVVHLERFADGRRHVTSVAQVLESSSEMFELEELFKFELDPSSTDREIRGALRYTGARPKFLNKFRVNVVPIPSWVQQ
jgi:pilus assembly protein CpaF